MERQRMNSSAKATFISLFALFDMTDRLGEDFRKIIEPRTDGGWEKFKEVQRLLSEISYEVMDSIPLEQLRTIKYQCENSNVRIAWKGAVETPHDGMWVMELDDLLKLARISVGTNCLLCDKTLGHPCDLRRILDDLPITIDDDGFVMSCRKGI